MEKNIKYLPNYKFVVLLIVLLAGLESCEKFVDVDAPKTELIRATVFEDNSTAGSAMSAVYAQMVSSSNLFNGGQQSVMCLAGFSSDELNCHVSAPNFQEFYTNNLTSANTIIQACWGDAYNIIYKVNAIIEGLNNSKNVTEPLKTQLIGEAKFIRAFSHFYLYNLFGPVPYITGTDYRINNEAGRNSASEVMNLLISDLKDAVNLLPADFSTGGGERIRINKWAATALLARVYLFNKDWGNAEISSSEVINQATLFSLTNLDDVFLKNSQEAIWQLKTINPSQNTMEGATLIFSSDPTFSSIPKSLYDLFEATDARKTNWIKPVTGSSDIFYCPYKYKIQNGGDPFNEYSMVLRLAEQYLIRAEARARQNKIEEAVDDLNMIHTRAGLTEINTNDTQELADAIILERRKELFVEWGHRWLDLKRTGLVNSIMSALKPGWSVNDTIYPIPQSETRINSKLTQNAGYP